MATTGVSFAYVNVLEDSEIFQNLPRYANWPTFPQIYINGELIGGCDITLELYESGELKRMMETAANNVNVESAE
jgi:monothiol glutaredoxin